jgi:hypothetical protein
MYQLQLVVVQQAAEEISHREVEAALEEGREDDLLIDIFARELLPSGSPPLQLLPSGSPKPGYWPRSSSTGPTPPVGPGWKPHPPPFRR